MKTFEDDFAYFKEMLEEWEPFTFARFSDGELYMLQNKTYILGEGKTQVGDVLHGHHYDKEDHREFIPGKHEFFRKSLQASIEYSAPGYYKGVCCPCCVPLADSNEMKSWATDQTPEETLRPAREGNELTWSNLWVNANYPKFIREIVPILKHRDVAIVCNENADLSGLPFEVKKDFRVGHNCQVNDYGIIEEIKKWITESGVEDYVFLFSAASLSESLCHQLHEHEPGNSYIDIGTCLNKHMKLSIKRSYLEGYWGGSGNGDLIKRCRW